MDVDIDLEYSDRISDFLRSKLLEIKSQNSHLETALKHRDEISSNLRDEITKSTNSSISLGEIWKKTINGKYVLGVEMKNDSANVLDNFTVTLIWNSSSSLTYQFHLLPNFSPDLLKCSPQISHTGLIILTLDIPLFTDQLSYIISGYINFQLNNKKIHLKLPTPIELRPQDIIDNTTIAHLYKVIDGTTNDFQALAFSSQKQEFVMILPERLGRTVENIFEAECALRRINIETEKKYFLVCKICPVLDGVLLEVDDKGGKEIVLNTYCKSVEVTVAFLHYLHTHIIGAIIVPRPFYQTDLSLGELTELVRDSLSKEIDQLQQFSGGDLRHLRSKVADLEYQTDIVVCKINEKRSS